MLPSQAKDVPVTEPKFDLERDFPVRIQFVRSATEAARLRAEMDRLAALRNAPEPNLDAEEEELPDFESTFLEPEPSTALSPVDGQLLPPAKPEDTENGIYEVDTGKKFSLKGLQSFTDSLKVSDPYMEEWEEEMLRSEEVECRLISSQLVTKGDQKDELSFQSGVKSLKYNIPSSSLPYAEDLRDILTFLRSKKIIHDFIVDNNTISIDKFLGSEEVESALYSTQLVTKEDKKEELSFQSGVKSLKYDIPSSSLPYAEDMRDLLTFLRSKKVIHDFMVDNNTISIDIILGSEDVENTPQCSQLIAITDKKDEISLKIPESIRSSPSKPGTSGSSKKTVTITYPKTQVMESQPSTSEFPKCPTDAETAKLSIAQATKSTDSPELFEELELRYPHEVYQYLAYGGMKVKVCTKDYCITCDPRYRRDKKTWLLHAKNRHYEGMIVSLYF